MGETLEVTENDWKLVFVGEPSDFFMERFEIDGGVGFARSEGNLVEYAETRRDLAVKIGLGRKPGQKRGRKPKAAPAA